MTATVSCCLSLNLDSALNGVLITYSPSDCPANCDGCASDENSSDLTCEKCTEKYGLNGDNKFCEGK